MSDMEIYILKHPAGVVETIKKENSFLGAPLIWDIMAQKYLNLGKSEYLFHTEKIWPLWKREDIPEHHRTVLGMTYDNMVITKEDFSRAREDILNFVKDFPSLKIKNHWLSIAALLKKDKDCNAIGFNWTSVNESLFMKWDNDLENYKPLDWKNYWSLYHRFDNQINKQSTNLKA